MEIKILASGSGGNCYRVSDGRTTILLDAGIPIKQIRVGCDFRLSEVSGCFVTHYHGDHSKAVEGVMAAGVCVYMPEGEISALGLAVSHRLRGLKQTDGVYQVVSVGTLNILPFRTEHDTPEPVGYLIGSTHTREKLLYFTDTFYLRWRFSGLTHIIGECNYDRETLMNRIQGGETGIKRAARLFSSHMSLDNFIDFLRHIDTTNLRQVYICHMSDDHGNEQTIKEAVQRQTGAEVYVC